MFSYGFSFGSARTHSPVPPPAAELPTIRELPDPFQQSDGSRLTTTEQWNHQRAQLQALILGYQYGQIPAERGPVTAVESSSAAHPQLPARISQVRLTCGPAGQFSFSLLVVAPKPAARRFPAIVSYSYGHDTSIWARVVDRGYLLVEFDRNEIAEDRPGGKNALRSYYPQGDGGRLAAWAWGFQIAVDYLLTRPDVAPERIAITGHSRCGKAALLAGAIDQRISLTCPNGSGCGGAGCYRFTPPGTEDLAAILGARPDWFAPHLAEFIGCVARLPFDQHTLKALVAPRALLSTEALGDLWANPEGTQQTYLAARKVFQWLGVGDRIGIHYRQGGHDHNLEDWLALLDYADYIFFSKPTRRHFHHLPFPANHDLIPWSAPHEGVVSTPKRAKHTSKVQL
jgi:hypothetical protein